MDEYRAAVAVLVLAPLSVCAPGGCGLVHEFLIVHKPRKSDAWQVPQGGIEQGENALMAAARELKEETGIDLPSGGLISPVTYAYPFPPGFQRRHGSPYRGQQLSFVVVSMPVRPAVTLDQKEVDAFAWVTMDMARKYIEREEYAAVLARVLAASSR